MSLEEVIRRIIQEELSKQLQNMQNTQSTTQTTEAQTQQTQPQPKPKMVAGRPHIHRWVEVSSGVYRCVGCNEWFVSTSNTDALLKAFTAVHRHDGKEYSVWDCPVCRPKLVDALKQQGYDVKFDGDTITLKKVRK